MQNPCPRGAVLIEADFPSVLLTWGFLPLILSSPCSSLVVSRDSGISPLDLMVSRLKFALVLELASQSCVCVCARVCVWCVCAGVCVCRYACGVCMGVYVCVCTCKSPCGQSPFCSSSFIGNSRSPPAPCTPGPLYPSLCLSPCLTTCQIPEVVLHPKPSLPWCPQH